MGRFMQKKPGPSSLKLLCVAALLGLTAWAPAQDARNAASVLIDLPLAKTRIYAPQGANMSPSPAVADSCLPLLKSIQSPSFATDRTQRSAGKLAALSLILGVRYALRPPEALKTEAAAASDLSPGTSYAITTDRSALAGSAYRQCRKEQALNMP